MPNIQKIADFFSISIDYLLGKTDSISLSDNEVKIALHSDFYYKDLHNEYRDEISNFIEFVKQKYKDK